MTENYIQGRSASGRPLCFPLKAQKNATTSVAAIEDEFNTQMPLTQLPFTQLHQPELSPEDSPRFSTAIYQILERVENKVTLNQMTRRNNLVFCFLSRLLPKNIRSDTGSWIGVRELMRFN